MGQQAIDIWIILNSNAPMGYHMEVPDAIQRNNKSNQTKTFAVLAMSYKALKCFGILRNSKKMLKCFR